MVRRRGDNIPSVKDYAHWNEDAERIWYEENKYDMEHADEIIEEDDDFKHDGEKEWDKWKEFDTEKEALEFFETCREATMSKWGNNRWVVEYDV